MKEEIFNILKLYRKSWRHHLKKEFPEFFKERINIIHQKESPHQ